MNDCRGLRMCAGRLALASLLPLALMQSGCSGSAKPQPPPPPEVSVIQVKTAPVTIYDEYVAQTQAPDTIEIRAQVTGLLERQAFADGAGVSKGELLYVIDRRPFQAQVAQAKASLAQARAGQINAQQKLTRSSRLLAEKFVSQQDYDNAMAEERAATALVDVQKALLQNAKLNLAFTTIRAPRVGYMSSSLVKPGALITAQQTLMTTLYSSDPMWVHFSVSEDKLLELQTRLKPPPREQPDQAPPFHLWLADGSEYKYPGTLNFVDATVDSKSGTLEIRLSVANPNRFLRPGLFVRVTVPDIEKPDAIRVPQQAVQELQGLKSVYVVGPDNKVQSRQIAASHRVGQDWVVDSGLAPGERVLVEGIGKLQPGMPVRPVMVARAGAPGADQRESQPSSAGESTAPQEGAPAAPRPPG